MPDVQDTGDIAEDTTEYPCRVSAETRLSEFHELAGDRAVNGRRIVYPYAASEVPCGAVSLLDTNTPTNIHALDTVLYPNSVVETAVTKGRVVVVALKYDWSRNPDGDVRREELLTVTGDVYGISGDSFERISRTSHLLSGRFGTSSPDFKPLALVANQNQTLLVGENQFVELRIEADDTLGVDRKVKRREERRALTQRLDNYGDGSSEYRPDPRRQVLTDDGYLVEVEHGISIWRLPQTTSGDNNSSALISFLPVHKSLYRTHPLKSPAWRYVPGRELVYLGESEPLRSDAPAERKQMEVIDVSDRSAPKIAARWDVTSDFSNPVETFPNLTSTPDRLYLLDKPGQQRHELTVFDLTNDPTSVDEIGTTTDPGYENRQQGEELTTIHATGDRLYLGLYKSMSGERSTFSIGAVDRQSLESQF